MVVFFFRLGGGRFHLNLPNVERPIRVAVTPTGGPAQVTTV